MARFDETGISPIQGGETIKSPVQGVPTTSSNSYAGLGAATKGIENLAKIGFNYFKKEGEKENLSIVNDFAQSQLKIADAVEQGLISSTEGRTRMRSNFQRYSANSPALLEEFSKVQGNIVSTAGLGKVVAEGTKEEQLKNHLRQTAASEGWLPQGAIGTLMEEDYIKDYLDFKRAGDLLQRSTAEIANKSARLNYDTSLVTNKKSKLELDIAVKSHQAKTALATMAGAYHNKFSSTAQDLMTSVDNGKMTREDAIMLLDQEFSNVQSVSGQVGAFAGAGDVEALTKPIQTVRDSVKDYLSGKTSKEVVEAQVDAALAKNKLHIVSNPKYAQLIATSNLLGNQANLALSSKVSETVLEIMKQNGSETGRNANIIPETPEEEKDTQTYLSLLRGGVKSVASGKFNPGEDKEVGTNLTNLFKGLNAYGAAHEDPKSYNTIVDFIASPEFGSYTSKVGGIPSEISSATKDLLSQNYEQQVLPLIQEKLKDAGIITLADMAPSPDNPVNLAGKTPADKFIEPVFVGSGVSFVKRGDPNVKAVSDKQVAQKVKELNKEVAPILNRLIRMSAHLEGTTDYKGVWEKVYSTRLGLNIEKKEKKNAGRE